MAVMFTAYIYGVDSTYDAPQAGGQPNGFAPGMCHFYPAPSGTTRGEAGVTCNAVIEVFATGLNQPSKKFYTASTVAQLITLATA